MKEIHLVIRDMTNIKFKISKHFDTKFSYNIEQFHFAIEIGET